MKEVRIQDQAMPQRSISFVEEESTILIRIHAAPMSLRDTREFPISLSKADLRKLLDLL